MQALDNVNIASARRIVSPKAIKQALPVAPQLASRIVQMRSAVSDIISGSDQRMLVVLGPCSIHDTKAAHDYLARLCRLRDKVAEQLLLVMRVYFEKPRTTTGWKGLINDPHLNDSFDLETGLKLARGLLLDLAQADMPAATEALDPIVPQYLGDLVSWYAIGARTTESQTHREMASGLSAPCGFKNGTDGAIEVAVHAMQAARTAHHFLGIDSDGNTAVIHTRGNPRSHVILRGGAQPNYHARDVNQASERLQAAGLNPKLVIDCSHGNSNKEPARQIDVAHDVVNQRLAGNQSVVGLMLESNLEWGAQKFTSGCEDLRYGVSITDACIDWSATESLITELAQKLAA